MANEKSGASGASAGDVDLFGAPVSQIRERWGRPSFAKIKENQELVALLAARGWKQERIARLIGCDPKTLRKNFSRELSHGADLIEAMALQVTFAKMKEGNSVATGRILEMVSVQPPPAPRPEPREEPIGKKAEANAAALTAHEGTPWTTLIQ